MFIEVHKEEFRIVHIWDTRRNPNDLIYKLHGLLPFDFMSLAKEGLSHKI